jgi:hypothetical protein
VCGLVLQHTRGLPGARPDWPCAAGLTARLQLGQPTGAALACDERSTVHAPALECARTTATWHGWEQAEAARPATWCAPEDSLSLGAPTRQQEGDQLAPKERDDVGGQLTGGNEVSRRRLSTARSDGRLAQPCMTRVTSRMSHDAKRRMG